MISIKRNSITKLVVGTLFICGVSYANIPVIDPSNIAALIGQSMQQIQQMVNMLNSMKNQFNLSGHAANSQIQAMQNNAANEIVRITQNNDDLFNKKLSMESKPAFDACSTFNISEALKNGFCNYITGVTHSVNNDTYNALGGNPDKTNDQNTQEAIQSVLQQQKALSTQTGVSTAGISGATFISPQLGGYRNKTSNDEATLYRKLILGPLPAKHMDKRLVSQHPYLAQKMRVSQETYAARKSVASTSLSIYQQMYTKGSDGVSPMGMMDKFVKDRYGNPTWIQNITNTNPDKKSDKDSMTTPSQVVRSIAESEAFGNYVKVKMYQSSLRQEVLLATIVSIMNKEPVQEVS